MFSGGRVETPRRTWRKEIHGRGPRRKGSHDLASATCCRRHINVFFAATAANIARRHSAALARPVLRAPDDTARSFSRPSSEMAAVAAEGSPAAQLGGFDVLLFDLDGTLYPIVRSASSILMLQGPFRIRRGVVAAKSSVCQRSRPPRLPRFTHRRRRTASRRTCAAGSISTWCADSLVCHCVAPFPVGVSFSLWRAPPSLVKRVQHAQLWRKQRACANHLQAGGFARGSWRGENSTRHHHMPAET